MSESVQFVEINGANIAYQITGSEDAPLMITLHGGRGQGTHDQDFKIYGQLSDKLRVFSFDYRGHGQSSRTKPYTFVQLVEDIEGVRKRFVRATDGKVIICGGSFGGFLAQQYAITYSSHVSHLILRGTSASYHHEGDAIQKLKERLHLVPSFSESMLRDKIFGPGLESDLEFRLVSFAMARLYKTHFDPDAALKSSLSGTYVAESHNDLYSETEKYFDYRSDLHKISAKTLIVVGDDDWICPVDNSRLITEKVRNAELLIVPGANHGVHIEKPEVVLSAIRKHLTLELLI